MLANFPLPFHSLSWSPFLHGAVCTHQLPSKLLPVVGVVRGRGHTSIQLTEAKILLIAASSWNSVDPWSILPLSKYAMDWKETQWSYHTLSFSFSYLSYILQHSHPCQLLLNHSIHLQLVTKLYSSGHLVRLQEPRSISIAAARFAHSSLNQFLHSTRQCPCHTKPAIVEYIHSHIEPLAFLCEANATIMRQSHVYNLQIPPRRFSTGILTLSKWTCRTL